MCAWNITGSYTDDVDTAAGSDVSTDLNAGANEVNGHTAATVVHGATGAVVGTTNAQTITNKTISTSNILDGTITISPDLIFNSIATTETSLTLQADTLTDGTVLSLFSNSADISARNLVQIKNDNQLAVGTACIAIQQDSEGNMVEFYDGANLVGYVDDEGQLVTPMLVPGQTQNIAIDLTGTTLAIKDAVGDDLSATNIGWVCVPSKVTPGTILTVPITANLELDLTDLDAFEFGITAGVNWLEDMPFFMKVGVSDTDNITFFISRSPLSGALPVEASIGDAGADPTTDSQLAHIAMTNITPADYDGNPCVTVGGFRMQYTGATTRWNVEVFGSNDGIGQDKVDATCAPVYIFPTGHNGALAGKYINVPGGATNLAFNIQYAQYSISANGMVSATHSFADSSANGNTATYLYFILPYSSFMTTIGSIRYTQLSATISASPLSVVVSGDSYYAVCYLVDSVILHDDDFQVAATCRFAFTMNYKAF